MFRTMRARPIEKPLIIQEIIYNHCEERVDSNSELSFLKLSSKASKEMSSPPDDDPFCALQTRLCKVQQRSALRLNQVQKQLNSLSTEKKNNKNDVEKQLIEENKQNLNMGYLRVFQLQDEHDHMLESKFEMDQNYNYVKNKEIIQSQPPSISHRRGREVNSLDNSRKKEGKEERPNALTCRKNRIRSKSLSCHTDEQQTSRKSALKQRSLNKQLRPGSSNQKRGRIYQQILSLYTIPKLLAMEPK